MTLNGAIMQLVQMRESECMPTMFKPLFDKVIETVSECDEPGTPSAQPEIIRCKDCKWFGEIGCAIEIVDDSDRPNENDFCSFAERKDNG